MSIFLRQFVFGLLIAGCLGGLPVTGQAASSGAADTPQEPVYDFAPMTIYLAGGNAGRTPQLRLGIHLTLRTVEDTELLEQHLPRVMDAIRVYFIAVSHQDLRDPAAIDDVRTALIEQIETATGAPICQELLFTQFLLY